MQQHKDILIKNYIDKAKDALVDAQINIDNKRLNAAQNRIYYAVFYSVVALGYHDNFISSKHRQLLGWFNKKYIYEDKVFDKEMFKIYEHSYVNRMESDYAPFITPLLNEVADNYNNAVFFVEKINKFIFEAKLSG
jgi:uncharacterized protein (UPF0332 family)